MSAPARTSTFKALRFSVFVALAGLGVAIFLIGGSYLYWQSEKRASSMSQNLLQDQRNRLEAIKRERDDLQGSEETYKKLIAGGAFLLEQRLDFVEAIDVLRKRHRLMGLEYDVFPQRPLKFGTGANYPAVDVMASRIRMKIKTYHDRDLVAFLDEFPRIKRGFFPIDQCAIKRVFEVSNQAPSPSPPAGQGSPPSTAEVPAATPTAMTDAVAPLIEADCTMEWITLKDKRTPNAPVVRISAAVVTERAS